MAWAGHAPHRRAGRAMAVSGYRVHGDRGRCRGEIERTDRHRHGRPTGLRVERLRTPSGGVPSARSDGDREHARQHEPGRDPTSVIEKLNSPSRSGFYRSSIGFRRCCQGCPDSPAASAPPPAFPLSRGRPRPARLAWRSAVAATQADLSGRSCSGSAYADSPNRATRYALADFAFPSHDKRQTRQIVSR